MVCFNISIQPIQLEEFSYMDPLITKEVQQLHSEGQYHLTDPSWVYFDMSAQSQKRLPLLGNSTVDMLLWQWKQIQQKRNYCGQCFLCSSCLSYIRRPTGQAEVVCRQSSVSLSPKWLWVTPWQRCGLRGGGIPPPIVGNHYETTVNKDSNKAGSSEPANNWQQ
jgi:hypothetical protein